ncbi:MAG: FAD-binding oxidoreductase [Rubrobacteraceae bacterium]
MDTKKVSIEELQEVVGEDNAREAGAEDAVEGVEPSFVVEPGSVEELSALMKLAAREELAVAPRGGGTKTHLGEPPRELDLVVSMARMDEIIEHVPGDQIARVQAGVKLRDLQEKLSEANQMLGLDPPEAAAGATIGGIIAANSSGPLRLRYGTVRDLIIGITVVLSDGTVAKAGGKVVKNVAGYDLGKLFSGSMGTLGIIAEANFRLHPIPEVARTVAVDLESPRAADEASQTILHSKIMPSACELYWSEENKLLTVLLESIPGGIEAKVEAASFLLKSFGEVRVLEEEEADALVAPSGEDAVEVKIGAPPAELTGVLESVLGAAERGGIEASITGHAATGVTFVRFAGGADAGAEMVEELREIWVRRGGSAVLQKAPPELKRKVGAWGPGGDSVGLMRRVKDKFDSRGGMNPGRFVGGI